MKKVRLVVVGFGSVGRSLLRILAYRKKALANRYSLLVDVVGVVDSRGMALKSEGFEEHELLKLCDLPKSGVSLFTPYARDYVDLRELYAQAQPNVHVELTPSNYATCEPGLSNMLFALGSGTHVVTANKAPIALRYDDLMSTARSRKLFLKFSATVMGGTPLIESISFMKSQDVEYVIGILNATVNYVLTEMHENLVELDQALSKARLLGIAEADPSLDIDGVDAAAKISIISHVIGYPVNLRDIRTVSLRSINLKDIVSALRRGYVLKQVATLDVKEKNSSVEIKHVHRASFLAKVRGVLNCVKVGTDASELLIVGKGGGGTETAQTVLNDVISVAERFGWC